MTRRRIVKKVKHKRTGKYYDVFGDDKNTDEWLVVDREKPEEIKRFKKDKVEFVPVWEKQK